MICEHFFEAAFLVETGSAASFFAWGLPIFANPQRFCFFCGQALKAICGFAEFASSR
jgi:hypothetical protein